MSVLGGAVDVVGLRAAVDSEDIPCRLFRVGDSNVYLEIGAANAAIRAVSALSELLREDGGKAGAVSGGASSYCKSASALSRKFEESLEPLNAVRACT